MTEQQDQPRRGQPATEHWVMTARRDGQPLPVMVTEKWRWYRTAAARHRRRYASTELAAICGAAAIPVAASASVHASIMAGLGALVLIATGVRTTFGLHESWVEHSRLRYDIEREFALFLAKAPPYDDDTAVQELILRVEDLTYEGGRRWASRRLRTSGSAGPSDNLPPAP